MDDLIIPSQIDAEGLIKLREVLKIAWIENKMVQVQFFKRKVQFGTIQPSKDKITAVKNFPPKSLQKIQSFLGLTGYFRTFVNRYFIIARPLTDLVKKDVPFKFASDQRMSFDALKTTLISDLS